MMKMIVRVCIFFILINMATGIMLNVFNVEGQDPVFDLTLGETAGLNYSESANTQFAATLNGSVATSAEAASQDTQDFLLLDKISLGIYSKVRNFLNQYLFSTIIILGTILQVPIEVITLFKFLGVIGIAYAMIALFTNKIFGGGGEVL